MPSTTSLNKPSGVRGVLLAASGLTATQAISAVASFITSGILAHALHSGSFGQYTYITANALLLAVLLDVRALQWTNALDIARGLSPHVVVVRTLRWLVITAVLAALVAAASSAMDLLRSPWTVAILSLSGALLAQLQACYQGREDFRSFNLQTIAKLALILAAAVLITFAPQSWRLAAALGSWCAAQLLVAAVATKRLWLLPRRPALETHSPAAPDVQRRVG